MQTERDPARVLSEHGLDGRGWLELDPTVLAVSPRGNGKHVVVKATLGGRPVVVKLYGRKRPWLHTILREIGVHFVGRSSTLPGKRCAAERGVLELWRRHGFDVPEVLDVVLPSSEKRPHLVLEWVPGRDLRTLVADRSVALAEKKALLARFARGWSRRHDLALELREPRLIQVHPGFHHVLVAGDRLVQFDFELTYTLPGAVPRLIQREIVGFLRTLRSSARESYDELLGEVTAAYGARERIEAAAATLARGRMRGRRWMRAKLQRLRGGAASRAH
jgi:tRNA A-37 threonylcarbamoyl transferase component Bud32